MKEKEKFNILINRFSTQGEMGDEVGYTDEEIIFMAKYDLKVLANKFPGVAEYYMEILSE